MCNRREANAALVQPFNQPPAQDEASGRRLEGDGWSVETAANGLLGIDALKQHLPGLILLDLMMPEMDGFQFLDELRKVADWREIPVVVVTAKDLSADERLRLNHRVEMVLEKGAYQSEDLLRETGRLVANRLRKQTPNLAPANS